MTLPKWVLPTLSVIVALAVGVAAVVVSGRFAPAQRVESNVETGTTTTTLYGPSGFGDDDVTELPEGAFPLSPEVGTIEVSAGLPADPGVTPLADAVERIADGGAAGDGIPTVLDDGGAGSAPAGDEPSASAEDPCYAGDDCPEGSIRGRIFALVSPPEYLVRARAFAPSEICPVPAGGGVPLLVFVTRPTDLHVTVARSDGGGRIQTFDVSTPAEIETAWDAALAAADSDRDRLPPLYFCLAMTDLEPGVTYRASASGTARDGSGATDTTEFNGSGPTHHPMLTVEPIGDGAAVAYAEHTADEQLAVRAWLVPEDAERIPDCYERSTLTEIPWRYRASGELTPEETGALLIPADADQRTAYGFQVPEGSTILFCAQWHPGAEAPSWERVQASFSDDKVLQTTDYVLPTVTLVRVDLAAGADVDALRVFGRTQEGMQCGGYEFDPAEEATALPHVVCELEGASTDFDVHEWSYRDLGFTGNIVIPMEVVRGGERTTGEQTLNIGDLMCLGGCATNPTTRYTIPLPRVAGRDTGQLTLQVSWEQGGRNGLVRPVVSDVPRRGDDLEAVGGVLPWATPMMDTDERMSYSGIDSSSLSGEATLHLVTDRPVDYEVTLEGLHEECAVGDAPLVATGHSEGAVDVTVGGLCFGHFYRATVRLTDEFGGSTTFAASRAGVTRWLASLIMVPKAVVRVSYSAAAVTPADSALAPGSFVTIDGTPLSLGGRTCTGDGQLAAHGVVPVEVSSHPVVEVHIATVPALTDDGVFCSGLATPASTTVVADGAVELDLGAIRGEASATTVTIGGLTLILSVLA
jgi:hypothetical protein